MSLVPLSVQCLFNPSTNSGQPRPAEGHSSIFPMVRHFPVCVYSADEPLDTRPRDWPHDFLVSRVSSVRDECLPFETSVPHHVEGLPPRGCFPGASHCPTLEESPSHLSRLPLQWSHRDSYFLYAWWWPTWGPSRMAGFPTGAFHYFNYHS
jgi:hypothetical protein